MASETIDFRNPQYYINRELSWIEFDRRCLSEARNKENPLFERLKFLSITASNLDEFFMVRVASLQDMVQAGYKKKDIAGMTAQEQLSAVLEATHTFMQQQYWTLNRQLIPALEEHKLSIVRDLDTLSKTEMRFIEDYYTATVFPVLTPMAVDSSADVHAGAAVGLIPSESTRWSKLASTCSPSAFSNVATLPSTLSNLWPGLRVVSVWPRRLMMSIMFWKKMPGPIWSTIS